GRRGRRLALQLPNRLGDELAVEVEPDGGDVAGLLGAEHVAGPADLEVAHGDLEPGPEIGELADRLEPLVGLFGEGLLARVEQVRVGALTPAADATAQLVQLREPEQIGAVDDERVDGRDVEAALD